jgi:hypothetical protein
MIIGPEYTVQAVAWAVVWMGLGLTARSILARRDAERRRQGHGRIDR